MEFQSFDDLTLEAEEARGKPTLSYGIEYLDKATGGIRNTDLVVIGGRTGAGKTELSSIIAQNNAVKGKKVYVFSLEAEPGEFVNRILFRRFAEAYHKKYPNSPVFYRNFMANEYQLEYRDLIQETRQKAEFELGTLNIFERKEEFGIREFQMFMHQIAEDADLVIVDHLHHFDTDTDNEVRELKNTVKSIRDNCLLHKKPIILIAHFRKADRKNQQLVPDLEEFHGSSEVSKEATQIITIAKHEDESNLDPCLYPTLFKVCKLRLDNSVAKFVGKQYFDTKNNGYAEGYNLYTLAKSGTELNIVPDEKKPFWTKVRQIIQGVLRYGNI